MSKYFHEWYYSHRVFLTNDVAYEWPCLSLLLDLRRNLLKKQDTHTNNTTKKKIRLIMTRWCPAPWSASQPTKDTPTNKTWQPTKDTHENALHLDLCGIYKKKKKTRIQTMWKHKRQMPGKKILMHDDADKRHAYKWHAHKQTIRVHVTRIQFTRIPTKRDLQKRPTKETYACEKRPITELMNGRSAYV